MLQEQEREASASSSEVNKQQQDGHEFVEPALPPQEYALNLKDSLGFNSLEADLVDETLLRSWEKELGEEEVECDSYDCLLSNVTQYFLSKIALSIINLEKIPFSCKKGCLVIPDINIYTLGYIFA